MASSSDEEADSHDAHELEQLLRAVAELPAAPNEVVARVVIPAELRGTSSQPILREAVGIAPKPGTVLEDRYLVERVLGRGGMGLVYAGKHLRTGKRVAIKWLLAGLGHVSASAAQLERFRREARAICMVQHANVVNVYDVGGSDTAPFLVMELLEGETLRQRLGRGPLSLAEAVQVLTGVAHGVSAAHQVGVIHRDLKPENIFLCARAESQAAAKVLDFGVAAVRGGSGEALASLTGTGAMLGTPSYMPLEQLTGSELDERADVYALGVVFYEALSGKLPFVAKTASELAVLQATARPTPISRYRPDLSGACDELLQRALSREADQRYRTVQELAVALGRLVSPIEPRRRSRFMLWAAANLLALAVSTAAILYLTQSTKQRGAPERSANALGSSKPRAAAVDAPAPPVSPPVQPTEAPGRVLPAPTPDAALPAQRPSVRADPSVQREPVPKPMHGKRLRSAPPARQSSIPDGSAPREAAGLPASPVSVPTVPPAEPTKLQFDDF